MTRIIKEDIEVSNKWAPIELTTHSGFFITVKDVDEYPTTPLPVGEIEDQSLHFVPTGRTGIVPVGHGKASGQLRAEYALYNYGKKVDLSTSGITNAFRRNNQNGYDMLEITTDKTIWVEVTKEIITYKFITKDSEVLEVKLVNKYLPNTAVKEIVMEIGIDTGAIDKDNNKIIAAIERHALVFDKRNKEATISRFTNLPKDIFYRIVSVTSLDYGYIEAGKDRPMNFTIDLNVNEVAFN